MTTEHYNRILEFLRNVSAGTTFAGHVYTVGGCCRDAVMGHEINDVDVAVDLPNGGISFARYLYERGLTVARPVYFEKYGTAMLSLREFPDDEIEIVQTRRGQYVDNEDPASVFGTLEDDARRRDLTVNTLYTDVSDGRIIDITGRALDDIAACRLSTPMSPEQTFEDDPVRMLRIIRFAARWGWDIDKKVLATIRRDHKKLSRIKIERMRAELEKMISGPHPTRALRLMDDCGLLWHLVPRFSRIKYTKPGDVAPKILGRTQRALSYLAHNDVPGDDLSTRWAVMLHGLGTDREGQDYLSADPESVEATVRLADAELRGVHHHSKTINPILFTMRHMRNCRKWAPDLQGVKARQLTALRRQCLTVEKFDRVLAAMDAVNHSDSRNKTYCNQVPLIRKRLAEIDAGVVPEKPFEQFRKGRKKKKR